MITLEINSTDKIRKEMFFDCPKKYSKEEYIKSVKSILMEEAEKELMKFLSKEHDNWNKSLLP